MAATGVKDATHGDSLRLSTNEVSVLQGLKALKDAGKIKKIISNLIDGKDVTAEEFNERIKKYLA